VTADAAGGRRPPVLAVVSYLNARPLIDGLAADCELIQAVPAECWRLVMEGAADAGLVPALGLGEEDGLAAVPGIAIGSAGPVRSVLVAARRPLAECTSVAIDRSSRTSVVLLKLILRHRYGVTPRFATMEPDVHRMLAVHDAALLIGDPALDLAAGPASSFAIDDLGAEWRAWTGLPFVYAVWAGREARITPELVTRLTAARDRGLSRIDALARAGAPDPATAERNRRYLEEDIRFTLGPDERAGLVHFLRLAADDGLLAGGRREPAALRFAGEPVLAGFAASADGHDARP
jgi:chorismate dehydratase